MESSILNVLRLVVKVSWDNIYNVIKSYRHNHNFPIRIKKNDAQTNFRFIKNKKGTIQRMIPLRWQPPTLPQSAVPSAQAGLTSLFGMDRGGTPPP